MTHMVACTSCACSQSVLLGDRMMCFVADQQYSNLELKHSPSSVPWNHWSPLEWTVSGGLNYWSGTGVWLNESSIKRSPGHFDTTFYTLAHESVR